jgi:hypothetical protein
MVDWDRRLEEELQEKGVSSVERAQAPLWGDGTENGRVPSRVV